MKTRGKRIGLGVVGGLIGVSATIWYWSSASRHVLAPQPWASPDKAFTRADRLDIMEAVYRHVSQSFSPADSPGAWFLGVGLSNDPPEEILQRLRNLSPPVRPISLAAQKESSIALRGAQMIGVDEAQVEAAIRTGSGSNGSERVYTVRREGGTWKVTSEKAK